MNSCHSGQRKPLLRSLSKGRGNVASCIHHALFSERWNMILVIILMCALLAGGSAAVPAALSNDHERETRLQARRNPGRGRRLQAPVPEVRPWSCMPPPLVTSTMPHLFCEGNSWMDARLATAPDVCSFLLRLP
jgi:hypothetical protein